ncbi:MAG: YciI family protein [Pseudomonadota bacterium]
MQYLLLIYSDEAAEPKPGTPEMEQHMQAYFTFTEEVRESGKMLGGEALEPVATATSVQVRDGKVTTTDGPFAETREQLGGFYMVDCDNLDEAIALAARIPSARLGTVEVRPVMMFDN